MFDKKYKDKEIEKILKSIIILVDTREKVWSHIKLWLKSNKINYEMCTLDFGDYSFKIPRNEQLGILEEVLFSDQIAIERKANAEEISNNLTEGRGRFKREFEKGNSKLRLLIEDSTYADISTGKYDTKLNSKSFIGSLHSFQEEFNSPFFFTTKEHSGEYIYNTFHYWLRHKLKNNTSNN